MAKYFKIKTLVNNENDIVEEYKYFAALNIEQAKELVNNTKTLRFVDNSLQEITQQEYIEEYLAKDLDDED